MASHRLDLVHRRRLTPQQRERLLAGYHRGRLTQREFAARHRLGVSTLVKWLQQERAHGQPSVRFQEVVVPSTSGHWALEVVNPQGWTVRWAQMRDAESVAQLLGALPC